MEKNILLLVSSTHENLWTVRCKGNTKPTQNVYLNHFWLRLQLKRAWIIRVKAHQMTHFNVSYRTVMAYEHGHVAIPWYPVILRSTKIIPLSFIWWWNQKKFVLLEAKTKYKNLTIHGPTHYFLRWCFLKCWQLHLITNKQCQVIWTIHWITRLHEQHCSEWVEIKSFTEKPGMEQRDKQRYWIYLKPLGTSRSVRALWYMKKCKRRKWAHLRDWTIKEYARLSLALIQSSLHQQIPST